MSVYIVPKVSSSFDHSAYKITKSQEMMRTHLSMGPWELRVSGPREVVGPGRGRVSSGLL